jgi:WD40 repeat protein
VRNRIYARVFDKAWIAANLPDAEKRRQRAAFRRGVWRTSVVSAAILALVGWLTFMFIEQRNRARQQAADNRRMLYVYQMRLAQQEWENANIDRVNELLDAQIPRPDEEDSRGFEWRLFRRLARGEVSGLTAGNKVVSVAFLPDGENLAFGEVSRARANESDEYLISLFNLKTRRNVPLLRVPAGENRYNFVFSPDKLRVATDSPHKEITLWDLESGRRVAVFSGHSEAITTIAFSPDGRSLASADLNGVVKLWDAATAIEIATLKTSRQRVVQIEFSPDGRLLAATDESQAVRLWEVGTWRELRPLTTGESSLMRASFSRDGGILLTTSKDGRLRLWDVGAGRVIASLDGHARESDGRELIALGATANLRVKLWNLSIGRELGELEESENKILCAAFSPDRKSLATGGTDGLIKLWDAATGRRIHTLKGHRSFVYGVNFSPDGKLLVSGGADHTLKLWNVLSGTEEAPLSDEADNYYRAVFSPDGKFVASAGRDNSMKLWDVAARKVVGRFHGHAGEIRAIAFSPDGRWLATGCEDNTVRLWDTVARQELKRLGQSDSVQRVVFSADGKSSEDD